MPYTLNDLFYFHTYLWILHLRIFLIWWCTRHSNNSVKSVCCKLNSLNLIALSVFRGLTKKFYNTISYCDVSVKLGKKSYFKYNCHIYGKQFYLFFFPHLCNSSGDKLFDKSLLKSC